MNIPTPPEDIDRLRGLGFSALTYPYVLPIEEEELARAQSSLAKGTIPYALVWHTDNEVEIWTIAECETPSEEEEAFAN